MKLHAAFTIALGVAAGLLTTGPMRGADTPAPAPAPAKGFDAFRLIKTRNIFDPDRRATAVSATTARPSALTTRSNFINLTGTMVAEGKTLAFFAGSRSEYSKVLSIGESVADFKVTGITTAQVTLEQAGKQIVVAVGKQVPLAGSSAAITVESAGTANAAAPPPDGTASDAPPADTSTPSDTKPADAKPGGPVDEKAEIIRRMMERREKELSK